MNAEHKQTLIEQGRAHRSASVNARAALRAGLAPDVLAPQILGRAGASALAAWLGSGALARFGALLPVGLRLWSVLARRKRLRLVAVAAAAAGMVMYLRRKKD